MDEINTLTNRCNGTKNNAKQICSLLTSVFPQDLYSLYMLCAVYDVPFWMCNNGRYQPSKLLALFFVPFILGGPLKEKGSKHSTSGLKQGRRKIDEARCEEDAQNSQQQECILSGGVYLRHRLKDNFLPFLSNTLYHKNKRRARSSCWRAGLLGSPVFP
jgi:hypothetical protein